MSNYGNYNAYVSQARAWDLALEDELHISEEQAHRIIRSILHVFRQQLPIEESMHLMAQLPLIWKGIYVEGWLPFKKYTRLHQLSDWLDAFRLVNQPLAAYDFGNDQKALKIFLSVWRVMNQFISEGELTQICNCLPNSVHEQLHKVSDEV